MYYEREWHKPHLMLDKQEMRVRPKQTAALMMSSIESARVFPTEAACERAHGSFAVLDRQVHFIRHRRSGVNARTRLFDCYAQDLAEHIEIFFVSDESAPPLCMQCYVIPAERNRRQSWDPGHS